MNKHVAVVDPATDTVLLEFDAEDWRPVDVDALCSAVADARRHRVLVTYSAVETA